MQRYFAKKLENDKFILLDSDIHHIKNVMRGKIGEQMVKKLIEQAEYKTVEDSSNDK